MANWSWREIETIWEHPDMTAKDLAELIPNHTENAIRVQRERVGRYNAAKVPLCCMCEQRPVWDESKKAKRYGLCKGCFLDEERMRLEDEAKAVALRQRRKSVRDRHAQ
jgi:hypothetical protein